jgi:hypothetical protein
MSIDTVDLLHAAEDEIGALRSLLDDIYEILMTEMGSSSDYYDAIGAVMERGGWRGGFGASPRTRPEYCRAEEGE